MEKQKAIKLLNDTFNSDFNANRFIVFIKELFNNFRVDAKSWTVWKEYLDYIESYQLLGTYEKGNEIIDILVVKLKKTSSRDRARTMQRNFVAKWLNKFDKNAALIAFYGDDPQDWRFSFVKMEYNLVKDESGKVKVSKELTPAKRYSFLVGVNEPNHTCRSQFLKLIIEEETNPSLSDLEEAFSIDKVTKEFFMEYKELFLRLNESLQKILKDSPQVKREFEDKGISTVDFSKKLLGQIVFIYFLQKKGWLGVGKNDNGSFRDWGSGPKNFLRKLFENEIVPYDNFFNDILEPLFYEALATERDDDFYSRFNCKIPFLNGGLFEPINDYNWAGTEILLDNSIFNSILSTFDRFNFTVKEDEPLDKEVAVDPEMLGKVFENLLEVKDRKSKGAYYTPREIVHYMCQQSLVNYLETNTSIARKDIEEFIQLGEFATGGDLRIFEEIKAKQEDLKLEKISSQEFQKDVKSLIGKLSLPNSIVSNRKEIDRLLDDIKIVDPAVGSGAFLVGMLNEIIKAKTTLLIFSERKRSIYSVKRDIIENCLYGVDIEPSAVDIAKLRFWLSLIVDELDMHNIKPLPNLDHKIICGNSLLEEFEGIKLFDEKLLGQEKQDYSYEIKQIDKDLDDLYKEEREIAIGKSKSSTLKEIEKQIKKLKKKRQDALSGRKCKCRTMTLDEVMQKRIRESQKKLAELKELQKKFFSEQNRKLKMQYRKDIDRIEWELIEETLKEQNNEEAIKKLQQFKKNRAKPFFLWKLYFAEVFQRENPGFDVVIANPPYVPITTFPKEIKEILLRNYSELGGTFSGKIDLYAFFILLSFKKLLRRNGNLNYIIPKTILSNISFTELRKHISEEYQIDELADLEKVFEQVTGTMTYLLLSVLNKKKVDSYPLMINNMDFGGKIQRSKISIDLLKSPPSYIWVLSKQKLELIRKIEKDSEHLSKRFITKNGVCTGSNSKFLSEKKENNFYRKIKVAKDISKYHIKPPSHYVYYKRELLHRPREEEIFIAPKIITQMIRGLNTRERLICALDFTDELVLNNINIIRKRDKLANLKFLLAMINSEIINFYFKTLVTDVNIKTIYLDQIPIKKISPSEQKPFIEKVDEILNITKDEDYLTNDSKKEKVKQIEKEIDKLVYKLYDLTSEEIKIVEENVR